MKPKVIIKFLSMVTVLITASMVLPWILSIRDDQHGYSYVYRFSLFHLTKMRPFDAFTATIIIGAVVSFLMWRFSRSANLDDMGTREAYASVTFSWIAASLLGCLPYLLTGSLATFPDAFFETMSGFTTTGASVFAEVERLPRCILLWRSETQWLGGMGIVVLMIALIPVLSGRLSHLFQAESPGPVLEKTSPTINDMAKQLWLIYLGITVVGTIVLFFSGMTLFDSVCHMFATVSTGGFSTKNSSIAYYNSPLIEWELIFFMFISGMNFTLHLSALMGKSLRFYKDNECMFYIKVTAIAAALISAIAIAAHTLPQNFATVRCVLFQVVSVMTTTGFSTADFGRWPFAAQTLLLVVMAFGGCAGSTAGGMKCVRVQSVLATLKTDFPKLLHPNAVIKIRIGETPLPEKLATATVHFILLYLLITFAGTLILSLPRQDIVTSFSAALTSISNVGPGLGLVGPVCNFESQTGLNKLVCSFLMLCGRLELYTVLVIFSPDAWRK